MAFHDRGRYGEPWMQDEEYDREAGWRPRSSGWRGEGDRQRVDWDRVSREYDYGRGPRPWSPGDRAYRNPDAERGGLDQARDELFAAFGSEEAQRRLMHDEGIDPRAYWSARSGAEAWRMAGPQTGRGPRGYRRSDESIKEAVCERLTWHGWVDASDMEVRVDDGVVTLEGSVPHRQMRRTAEEAVENCPGVTDVQNRLKIRAVDSGSAGDDTYERERNRRWVA